MRGLWWFWCLCFAFYSTAPLCEIDNYGYIDGCIWNGWVHGLLHKRFRRYFGKMNGVSSKRQILHQCYNLYFTDVTKTNFCYQERFMECLCVCLPFSMRNKISDDVEIPSIQKCGTSSCPSLMVPKYVMSVMHFLCYFHFLVVANYPC